MATSFEGFELANIDKQTWLKDLIKFTHQDWHNITELEFDPNGEINLNGRVQGRSRTPYTQFITLHPEYTTQRGHIARWHVNGNCSYPVGYNCKHVTATDSKACPQNRADYPRAAWTQTGTGV